MKKYLCDQLRSALELWIETSDPIFLEDLLMMFLIDVEGFSCVHDELVNQLTKRSNTWLRPFELALLLGLHPGVLEGWQVEGVFRANSFRQAPGGNGVLYHAELALRDAVEILNGSPDLQMTTGACAQEVP